MAPRGELELLSPAGDRTSLQAALDNGCNAVYFGVSGFNMRATADNFQIADLPQVATLCHGRGVKAYLALNTIQFADELEGMRRVVKAAADAGVDAVICWDHAVLGACRDAGIPIHLSTQASVSNAESILHYYRAYDVRRFVLARECTLDHVTQILNRLDDELGEDSRLVELEAFAHGAMCVSVSGRCFLSEHTFGCSGNRGACLQPCRREYRIIDVDGEAEYVLGSGTVMSPKDLCTLPFLHQLVDAGITSFKIEGRNRNPEYVAIVTQAYRALLDVYLENHAQPDFQNILKGRVEELMPRLESVYHRGFSDGFYMGKPMGDWAEVDGSAATMTKAYCGTVVNYYAKIGVAEVKIQDQPFAVGDQLLIQGPTTGNVEQTVDSMEVEHQPVQRVERGASVALRVEARVRSNDKVYVRRSREA